MDKQGKDETFLIVVYGLPASGKSTFNTYLHQQVLPNSLLISADIIQLQILTNPQLPSQLYKLTPQQLLSQLHKISQPHIQTPTKKAQFNKDIWKQSRQFVQYAVQKLIKFNTILVDDDLLLRSQRKVYRKIAWMSAIRYVQIFMDSDLRECLDNLKHRNQRTQDCVITEQVIIKAAEKLQIQSDKYCLKLKQKDRHINHQTILSNLHVVQIIPNDPNNQSYPHYQQHKPKHEHTNTQKKQLQARNYIHTLLKLSKQQLIAKFGSQLVEKKSLHNKNILANVLSNWKKVFIKSIKKQQTTNNVHQHFSEYINKL